MKRLLPLFCILVVLFASAGVASANSSQPDQFTITGTTTSYDYRITPRDRTAFNATAAGTSSGYLTGSFTFKERGNVDLDPSTFEGSGKGVNTGLLTIVKLNEPNTQVTIWFGGQVDYFAQNPQEQVRGIWRVIEGKGAWKDLEGHGTYSGGVFDPFTVVFTGDFD